MTDEELRPLVLEVLKTATGRGIDQYNSIQEALRRRFSDESSGLSDARTRPDKADTLGSFCRENHQLGHGDRLRGTVAVLSCHTFRLRVSGRNGPSLLGPRWLCENSECLGA